jgi:hypothetical protein
VIGWIGDGRRGCSELFLLKVLGLASVEETKDHDGERVKSELGELRLSGVVCYSHGARVVRTLDTPSTRAQGATYAVVEPSARSDLIFSDIQGEPARGHVHAMLCICLHTSADMAAR